MNWKPDEIGHGYNDCLLRVEHRPLEKPHSKEELIKILDILKSAGVDAWWYSVSAKGSYPLFPSKVLPYRKDVSVDYYPWLVEEAHKRDIVIFSWEYLNTAPLLMEEHPDWRVEYLKGPEVVKSEKERHSHFACFNSPYGELLKDYCVEVFNEIGFDGIWFDGCYLYGPADDGYRWSCCCERCAKKFKDETGLAIPREIDWSNPVFPEFLKWRYKFFVSYWKELSDYVRSKNKTALIAFNFFNRHYMGAVSGSPLEQHKMDALIAAEGTALTVQMQTKTLRAVSNKYPPEVWTALLDGVKLSYPSRPNPEPSSLIFYAQAAATAGGYASYGLPEPSDCTETLKALSEALAPLKGNIGGTPLKMCGLVFSGMTKDFAYGSIPCETHHAGKCKPVVDAVYGTGFILNALHYPFEIILDNQLDESLKEYKAIILPDVQCMADTSLEALEEYVRNGGTLIALGECGTRTPDGTIRIKGVLDRLFGIKKRDGKLDYCILEPCADFLKNDGLPERYMISGKSRLLEVDDDVKILSYGKRIERKKTAESVHDISDTSKKGVTISERRIGKGRAVYLAPSMGTDYSQNPNKRSREVFKRILGKLEMPYSVTAPPNVNITAWEKDGRLVFHILNQPDAILRMQGYSIQASPEDFIPVGPIEITVHKAAKNVSSPYKNLKFKWETDEQNTKISIDKIFQHAIINFLS